MNCLKHCLLVVGLTVFLSRSASAVEPGQASGTFTLDAQSSPLAYAACYEGEDLYDSSKKNTFVVLTDAPLGDTSASDDWTLAQRAKSGDLVVLTVRLDGRCVAREKRGKSYDEKTTFQANHGWFPPQTGCCYPNIRNIPHGCLFASARALRQHLPLSARQRRSFRVCLRSSEEAR